MGNANNAYFLANKKLAENIKNGTIKVLLYSDSARYWDKRDRIFKGVMYFYDANGECIEIHYEDIEEYNFNLRCFTIGDKTYLNTINRHHHANLNEILEFYMNEQKSDSEYSETLNSKYNRKSKEEDSSSKKEFNDKWVKLKSTLGKIVSTFMDAVIDIAADAAISICNSFIRRMAMNLAF